MLESAGWNLPVALVMERARVSSETARQALSKADSSVSAAVKLLTEFVSNDSHVPETLVQPGTARVPRALFLSQLES